MKQKYSNYSGKKLHLYEDFLQEDSNSLTEIFRTSVFYDSVRLSFL